MELCVCVSVRASLKAAVRFSVLSGLSVKSPIVPLKTKELLCVQTQQAVASHSVELCSNLPVFLLVSPSLTITNKQGAKFSRDGEDRISRRAPLSKSRHCGLPLHDRRRMEERRKGACHSGEWNFSSVTDSADLVRTLTVYSVGSKSSVGRYHTDICHTWSWIPIPSLLHLLIPADSCSRDAEKIYIYKAREAVERILTTLSNSRCVFIVTGYDSATSSRPELIYTLLIPWVNLSWVFYLS